jgi:GMP synthase PP-ATPase subunit
VARIEGALPGDLEIEVRAFCLRGMFAEKGEGFITTHWAHLHYDFVDRVARRIVKQLSGVSRVVHDIGGKPPTTIERE